MFRARLALPIAAASLLILSLPATASIPGYARYRTVEETQDAMRNIALSHADLATLIDIGDSWEKSEPGGPLACRVHPVPCRGSANIELSLSSAAAVTIEVLDMRGRLVRSISRETFGAGTHRLLWDGRDDCGLKSAPCVYAVRVLAAGEARTVEAVLLQ